MTVNTCKLHYFIYQIHNYTGSTLWDLCEYSRPHVTFWKVLSTEFTRTDTTSVPWLFCIHFNNYYAGYFGTGCWIEICYGGSSVGKY